VRLLSTVRAASAEASAPHQAIRISLQPDIPAFLDKVGLRQFNAEAFASPYGSCLLSLRSLFGIAVSRCGFSHRLPLWRSQHGLLEHQVNRPAPCNPRPFRATDAFLGGLPARLPSRPQDYRLMFTAVTSALSEPPCPAATAKTSHCDDHSARRGFSFISKGAARRQVPLFA